MNALREVITRIVSAIVKGKKRVMQGPLDVPEESEEPGFGSAPDTGEFSHCTWVLPVSEPNPVSAWSTPEVDDES